MATRTIMGIGAATVVALAGLAACTGRNPEPLAADAAAPDMDAVAFETTLHGAHFGPDVDHQVVNRWIAGLRQATVKFHDFEAAAPGGYDTPLLECMELPGVGGQGLHYGDMNLILDDGALSEFEPELLMYEPQKNGRKRLTGVEFIVPYEEGSDRPEINGVKFHHNVDLGLWVLHVWIWKHNPAGMFENWNPTVSCEFAD